MEHVAILRKSSGLLEKILSREKKIESRWYMARYPPWDRICAGETIYFKYAGMPVQAKAKVKAIKQYSGLTPEKVKDLWIEHARDIGVVFDKEEEKNEKEVGDLLKYYVASTASKKYCILIFLDDEVERITKPFNIDKKGFGNNCAWIVIDKVSKIKRRSTDSY
jgi:hypothetical protein